MRRFAHEWEREASLRLRAGDPTVVQTYLDHGRVVGGDRDTMLDAMYAAWRADTVEGRRSLMIAADASTVADLNARARAEGVSVGKSLQLGFDSPMDSLQASATVSSPASINATSVRGRHG